jgi:Excalibur calcium-binding domain
MLLSAILLVISPIQENAQPITFSTTELRYTKKRKRSAGGGSGHHFSSCAAARKAGYTHMRRGRAGYSTNLDRDGDGIACDKVR